MTTLSSNGTNANESIIISNNAGTLKIPDDIKDDTGVTVNITFAPALFGGSDEASAKALTDATVTDLAGGYYKVEDDITFDHTLNIHGDTYLTIAGGKTMSVSASSGYGINSNYALNIIGEGTLNVSITESYKIQIIGSRAVSLR